MLELRAKPNEARLAPRASLALQGKGAHVPVHEKKTIEYLEK